MQVRLAPHFKPLIALLCALQLLLPVPSGAESKPPAAADAKQEKLPPEKLPKDQLDSLVAPIALYPDPLLAQVLAASTYPLELVQLQQWLTQNKKLKDQALVEAVKKQNWDPSVQSMAPLPDVVKLLTDDIKWTAELGNVFLAQQKGVMDAVQRMRSKAQQAGTLKSSEQLKVETKTVDNQSVVVIEQPNPQVVYVPSYNPTVVYGAPVYPYPAVAYPPAAHVATGMFLSFGVGMAMGAAFNGGWGYNCGWGGGNANVNINRNNTFVKNTSAGAARGGGNQWQHNPQHRGGAPYSNRATADRYGGTTRGSSTAQRQESARRQDSTRQQAGAARSADNRVGNRQVSTRPNGGSPGSMGAGSRGYDGASARASSARGSASRGGAGGGGMRGGGGGMRGGGGGGMRGGGGRGGGRH